MLCEILVWEYFSGGGLVNEFLSASLLCEGVTMLRAIARDFAYAGYKLVIPLDNRLLSLKEWLPAARIVSITGENDLREVLKHEAGRAGSFFIIAPEFDSLLFSYTCMLEEVALNMGCSSGFIKIFGNKWETWKFWKGQGINTPQTWELPPTITQDELLKIIQEYSNKIIIKPSFGAGAENIFSCSLADMENPQKSLAVLKKIGEGGYLAQEFIPGFACSANLVVMQDGIKVVCVNDQIIELSTSPDGQSHYMGGISPAQSLLKSLTPQAIQDALQPLVASFPSPEHGIFGIDFICDPKGCLHFIEVNSRPTTSLVALSQVIAENPISMMIKGKIPSLASILTQINIILYYRKVNLVEKCTTSTPKMNAPKVLKMPVIPHVNLACPPLQDSYGNVSCFLSVAGSTCEVVAQNFSAAKQFLLCHYDQ